MNEINLTQRDVPWLFAWSFLLFLCAITLRSYYLVGLPPMWDNLVYQLEGLRVLRLWLDGHWLEAISAVFDKRMPAHAFTLAASFLMFDFRPWSPYAISAIFGFGSLALVYILALELGASRRVAFGGALAVSLLPNFIYQNFLQTRNDFQSAFFITLSWIFFLRAVKREVPKFAFYAGLSAGAGALFKAALPGYVIWGILAYLLIPGLVQQRPALPKRIRYAALYAMGAILACGWYYFPNLREILSYYGSWSQMGAFQDAQYALVSSSDRYLFYWDNLRKTHLSGLLPVLVTVFGLLLAKRFWHPAPDERSWKSDWTAAKEQGGVFIFFAALLPILFLPYLGSLSSAGDTPVLLLLAALLIATASYLASGYKAGRLTSFVLAVLFPFMAVIALSNLPIVEKHYSALSFHEFNVETRKFREQYGLRDDVMMQVYSHPVYNVDALYWAWLIDPRCRDSLSDSVDQTKLIFPEDPKTIAGKLEQFPMLILSDAPGTLIGGESFHTFNRLYGGIHAALEQGGHFLKLKTIPLENGRFPVHLALNKNYVVLRPAHTTPDNWVEWGGDVEYFALAPAQLRWRGIPAHPVDGFQLRSSRNPATVVSMKLNQVLPGGVHEYLSETMISPPERLTTFVLEASPDMMVPASDADQRKLAFYKVEGNALTSR